MSDGIAELLPKVHALQRRYQMVVEPPASPEQIATLREAMPGALGIDLPEGYASFLAASNGLDWNGTQFYATERRSNAPGIPFLDGVIDANLDVRDHEPMARLLVLGQSGMEIYVYEPASGSFRILDTVSLDTYEHYTSFEELFAAAIVKRL